MRTGICTTSGGRSLGAEARALAAGAEAPRRLVAEDVDLARLVHAGGDQEGTVDTIRRTHTQFVALEVHLAGKGSPV
jgi:hypothetical protein